MQENTPIIPDYVADDIKKEKKQYGTSVFDFVPEEDKETVENDFFDKNEYDSNEIESQRSEIRKDYNGEKISEKVSTDALSGIKSSVPEEQPEESISNLFETLTKEVQSTDIRGKAITNYGRQLIKSLIGELPTEEEEKQISSKFEELSDISSNNFFDMSIEDLESIISQRMIDQLKVLTNDGKENYKNILARFIQQIFIPYSETLSYKDEISNLNNLAKELDSISIPEENKSDNAHMSLPDIQSKITDFLTGIKKLDGRNSRLRQDYTINDIDTKLVSEVQECLNTAINFEKVKTKVDVASKKFKKDIRRIDDVNKSIDNWIHSIKHDPHTLFTFPCNDYLSDEESREELIKFFFNTYLVDIVNKKSLDIPVDKELEDYLIEENYISEKDVKSLKYKAWIFLYILSRTFKYNKIENNEANIRILSYTLDLISKLGITSHRDRFIEASDYVYEKLI